MRLPRDRRRRRFRADCPAQILVHDLAPTHAIALDLSNGGTFLETGAGLPLGLQVKVHLLPPGRKPMLMDGRVLRVGSIAKSVKHPELEYLTVRVAGLAVKFQGLDRETERTLAIYLMTLEEL